MQCNDQAKYVPRHPEVQGAVPVKAARTLDEANRRLLDRTALLEAVLLLNEDLKDALRSSLFISESVLFSAVFELSECPSSILADLYGFAPAPLSTRTLIERHSTRRSLAGYEATEDHANIRRQISRIRLVVGWAIGDNPVTTVPGGYAILPPQRSAIRRAINTWAGNLVGGAGAHHEIQKQPATQGALSL